MLDKYSKSIKYYYYSRTKVCFKSKERGYEKRKRIKKQRDRVDTPQVD